MLIGTHQRLATTANFNVSADSTNLEQVQKFKYLGIFLDHTLLWKEHISYIGSKISSRLGMIRTERAKSCHDQLVLEIFPQYRYLYTGNSAITTSRFNDIILALPWHIVKLGFHCTNMYVMDSAFLKICTFSFISDISLKWIFYFIFTQGSFKLAFS